MEPLPLVLASASPRRRDLLEGLGLRFEVLSSGADETPLAGELPEAHVARLAAAKAAGAGARLAGREALVLAADTIVAIDGTILGKPTGEGDALAMLQRLSGRRHEVWTGCALLRTDDGRRASRAVRSLVRFAAWDPTLARWYVASGEPMDKAGAYALQGRGALLTDGLQGSWSNVVGLPLEALPAMFREVGDDFTRRLVERGAGG